MIQTMQNFKMIPCPKCNEDFPEKRKELGYHVCVNCSTAKPVVGITTVEGTGDHTYNDLIIMDAAKARRIAQAEAEALGNKKQALELLDLSEEGDIDENAVSQSVKDNLTSIYSDNLGDDY